MKSADRESQRQIYRQTSVGEKLFIPAKPKSDIFGKDRIFRVCAYCRVSTENDEQLSSFELQQAHYEQLMGSHPNWDLRKIYADEYNRRLIQYNGVSTHQKRKKRLSEAGFSPQSAVFCVCSISPLM